MDIVLQILTLLGAVTLFLFGLSLLSGGLQKVAGDAEHRINACRDELRERHITNLENAEYNYQTGVYYIDIVYELEKMGDYLINVSQAIIKENEPAFAL